MVLSVNRHCINFQSKSLVLVNILFSKFHASYQKNHFFLGLSFPVDSLSDLVKVSKLKPLSFQRFKRHEISTGYNFSGDSSGSRHHSPNLSYAWIGVIQAIALTPLTKCKVVGYSTTLTDSRAEEQKSVRSRTIRSNLYHDAGQLVTHKPIETELPSYSSLSFSLFVFLIQRQCIHRLLPIYSV